MSSALAVSQVRECERFDFPTLISPWCVVSDIRQTWRKRERKKQKSGKRRCHTNEALIHSLTRRGHKPIEPAHCDTVRHPGERFLPCTSFFPHFTSSPPSSPSSVSYILFVLAIISSLCTSLASWRLMNFLSLRIQWLL